MCTANACARYFLFWEGTQRPLNKNVAVSEVIVFRYVWVVHFSRTLLNNNGERQKPPDTFCLPRQLSRAGLERTRFCKWSSGKPVLHVSCAVWARRKSCCLPRGQVRSRPRGAAVVKGRTVSSPHLPRECTRAATCPPGCPVRQGPTLSGALTAHLRRGPRQRRGTGHVCSGFAHGVLSAATYDLGAPTAGAGSVLGHRTRHPACPRGSAVPSLFSSTQASPRRARAYPGDCMCQFSETNSGAPSDSATRLGRSDT